jgi:PAS domain S-box-containing protein
LIVSDAKSGRIVEVNAAFEQRSGFSAAQMVGQSLDIIDRSHSREQRLEFTSRLNREGSVRYRCQRPRADGTSYQAVVLTRLDVREGKLVHYTVVRDLGEMGRLQQSLALLAEAIEAGAGDEGVRLIVRLLVDWLELDYVTLISARPEQVGAELPKGGSVVLYTDGVIESRRGRDLFGTQRMDDLLSAHATKPAQVLADALLAACRDYAGGDLPDDCAIVKTESVFRLPS